MYDGNETLSILTALADKIDCLRGSLECFVHEASVFDYQVFVLFYVLVVRPVLISFTIISPTEVLYAPPYYL